MSEWTPAEIERARALFYDEGLSSTKVGKLMGISRNAVIGRLYRRFGPLEYPRGHDRKAWKSHFSAREAARKRVQPQKPAPRTMTPQTTIDAPERPLRLLDLKPHHCRWIVGEVSGEAIFCGEPKDSPTSSWCARHHKIVWAKHG